ncbi:MAG: DUF349 domain-containing protein [Chitinophagaceae bacterium]|nr:DUF349 domain-containing protein [Chitinophagaceae bacterium]
MSTANYIIQDEKVFLPGNAWFSERAIAELKDAQQQSQLIAMLEERFLEVAERVKSLQTEFDQSEDKIKLAGRLSRMKSDVCSSRSIGDFAALLTQIDTMEAAIKVLVDEVLKQKEACCLEAEALLETKEWKEGTEKLRDLQKKMKDFPNVPDIKGIEYRDRFEKAKDEFFKLKQASFESFEQDLLDNLDKKTELCEKAEALQNSTEWKKATEQYQLLNDEWKKIGMVPKHRIEELWFRFSTAKDIFFNRKREHFGDIKTEQEENLVKKLELIAKAEALKESTAWKQTSEAYAQLMEEWKKIGRVPQEKSDEVWNAFLAPKNHFFQQKDQHYSGIRMNLDDNFTRKMNIVNHAESLQNSMDFETATQEFMDMFEEWKTIGRIPKEHGDEPWERFLKAKKTFFDRKDAARDSRKVEQTKDLRERIEKNRAYMGRLRRDMQREEELLFDVEDRLKNLPPTLRSYEKREQYNDMLEEIREKVNSLKDKIKEVKDKLMQEEREFNYIMRGPKKKENDQTASAKSKNNGKAKAAPEEDSPTGDEKPEASGDSAPAMEMAAPVDTETAQETTDAAIAEATPEVASDNHTSASSDIETANPESEGSAEEPMA